MSTYAFYEVRAGDRIEWLASQLLGDVRRWRELVLLNRLDAPYLADDPEPYRVQGLRVFGPGDRLAYQGPEQTLTELGPTLFEAEVAAYGRDLKLEDGYLVPLGGSLAMVAGRDNLHAALRRRMTTALGGLPAHPSSYGHRFRQYVGTLGGAQEMELLRLEGESVLLQDSRVASAEVALQLEGNLVRLEATVEPVTPSVRRGDG